MNNRENFFIIDELDNYYFSGYGASPAYSDDGRLCARGYTSKSGANAAIRRNNIVEEILPNGGKSQTLWRAVEQFREQVLTIREDAAEGSSVISIEWTDPATAARWANEYAALANELVRTRALQQAESNIEYLRKQVEETNVVELERVIYNLIESQIQTLMLANARDEYAFTVVDPAVAPETRTSPRRKLIVLSGGALGVFFGVLAAFAINIFRQITTRELLESG